ncbi:YbgC/FadM family acyl-CoA thioesterase [Pelomonas sp. SE-A7]|uniref:YbgC/FadM family acyl-CoA thioesterase n=1 Tax=Pelomonas sp. SE-A7 TaxID=3054953 RepID=UPI00259D12EA|nr:YbgC/FadM family acyl-CoA thioesterase [Pelomonas sp. SE-A7]MDM4765161.1 YbgC/FadM family acyl-CoA thioesterase [Pelomonas sp. SE-A7]
MSTPVLKRSEFRHLERLRVRWAEIDAQQIVFNGHYLTYIDTAVGGYWRAMALPYAESMKTLDGDLFVRKATLEYLGSARYDDQLDVGIRRLKIGNTSMTLQAAVFRGDELLVLGELVYVFADAEKQVPKAVPQALRGTIDAFEAGEPMVTVKLGEWSQLGEDAHRIRHEVFVDEQKIPAELEWDAADDGCLHAVAYNRFGRALATGRLLEHVPGVAKVGRMAVIRSMRSGRIGREVLDALMKEGRSRGYTEVLLHAQLSAVNFYLRAGFVERGERFEEAGIGHVEMVRGV